MSPIHTVQTGGQASLVVGPTVGVAVTMIAVKDTNKICRLLGFRAMAMDTAGGAINSIVEVCHWSGASTGSPNGTAELVVANHSDDTAWTPTDAGIWYSVEPTVLTQFDIFPIHPTGWMVYDWPDGRVPESIPGGGFALRMRTPTGGTQADGVFGALVIEI